MEDLELDSHKQTKNSDIQWVYLNREKYNYFMFNKFRKHMDLVELCKRDHTQKKSPQNVVYCVVFSLCFIVNKICRVLLNSS